MATAVGTISSPAETTTTEIKGNNSETAQVLRRFISGTVGGVFQAVVSHPFDTIKSRIQKSEFKTIGEAFRVTASHEGLAGFYRGVTPPLLIMGFYNSLLFGINQHMTNLVTPQGFQQGVDRLPLWRVAFAAQLTAPFLCIAIVPCEVVKVKLQTQPEGAAKLYRGPLDCMSKVVQQHGISGLAHGYGPYTISRIVGLPGFFAGSQACKSFVVDNGWAEKDSVWEGIAGGVGAGFGFWIPGYPFDLIKTNVQASQGKTKANPLSVVRHIYRSGNGLAAFYRGLGVAMLRAIPANVSVWVGVEYASRYLISKGW